MVDVDGVLVRHPDRRGWSTHLERDLGVPLAALQDRFFAEHWNDIVHGRAALRDRLGPVLAEIAPSVPVAVLIDYWFTNDAHLDQRLLAELGAVRREGVEVHLATVQEHERAADLWERLDLRSRCDGLHYSAALGCSKPDAAFYRAVERRTGLAPGSIFFIDDRLQNVEAARACGWAAAVWTGREALHDLLERQGWTHREPRPAAQSPGVGAA